MLCIFEYVQIFSWKLNLLKEMRKCRKHAIVAAFNCSLLYSLHLFVVILLTDGGALAEILSQTIARKSVAAPQQTPPGYVVVSKSNDLPHGSSGSAIIVSANIYLLNYYISEKFYKKEVRLRY